MAIKVLKICGTGASCRGIHCMGGVSMTKSSCLSGRTERWVEHHFVNFTKRMLTSEQGNARPSSSTGGEGTNGKDVCARIRWEIEQVP